MGSRGRRVPKPPKCQACGKLKHSTWNRAVKWVLRVTYAGAPPLNIYRCPAGPGFHVTSQDWKRSQGRAPEH